MKQMILLVGNVASGKSTITKKLSTLRFINVVSRDGLRYLLGNGNYYFGKNEKAIKEAEEVLVEEILKTDQSVLIDDCSNVWEFMREKWIARAKECDYEVIVIETPKITMEEAVGRRVKDNHGGYTKEVWEEVYNKFNSTYEEPSLDEGIDAIFKLTTDDKVNHDVWCDIMMSVNSDYQFCGDRGEK